MISGSAAFEQIIDALQPKLSAQGFTLRVAREHAQTFGSRYMTFSDGTRFIRLVWDGREEWFVLEGDDAPHDRPSSGAPVWVNLTLQHFKLGEADARWVAEVVENVTGAFRQFSGESAERAI